MQILVVVAMILTELFGPLVHAALKTEVEHVSVGTAVVYGSVDPKPKVKHRSIAVPKPVERASKHTHFLYFARRGPDPSTRGRKGNPVDIPEPGTSSGLSVDGIHPSRQRGPRASTNLGGQGSFPSCGKGPTRVI